MFVAIFALLLTASSADSARCQDGWLEGTSACYQYVSPKKSWSAAEADCQTRGPNGHLATINTAEHQALLTSDRARWIGLNDIDNERGTSKTGWVWVSGAPYGKYMNWDIDDADPEPNNNGDCIFMYALSGNWSDQPCDNKKHFICQIDLAPMTLATTTAMSEIRCAMQCASNSLCTSFNFIQEDLMCELINQGAPKERPDTAVYREQFKLANSTHWVHDW